MKSKLGLLLLGLLAVLIGIASYLGIWVLTAFRYPMMYVGILSWHVLMALLLGGYQVHKLKKHDGHGRRLLGFLLGLIGLGGIVTLLGLALGLERYDLAITMAPFCVLAALVLVWMVWSKRAQAPRAKPDPARIGPGLPRWNVHKGLSGTIFGDAANFLAVVAGLGGYKVLAEAGNGGAGWWYLGITGGWLALLVGLSLHYRWLHTRRTLEGMTAQNPNGWVDPFGKFQNPDTSFEQRAAAIVSEIVGVVTILSMLAPTDSNHSMVQIGGIVSASLLLVFAGVCWVFGTRAALRMAKADIERSPAVWSTIWTGAVQFIAAGFAVGFTIAANAKGPIPGGFGTAATILGIVGALCWLLAELFSSWSVTKSWMQSGPTGVRGYLGWEKNIWEVLGALATLVYLCANFAEIAPPGYESGVITFQVQTLWMTVLFFAGALWASIGTIRGIVAGVLNQLHKRGRAGGGA
jgi:hypothetical protein